MANKIDKINVGGADYEINLPTTATPTISSLTITGNLTVSGTANLSVISSDSDTLSITLSGVTPVITTASGNLVHGAASGIGAYLGGGFEVYGSEGLYITCDGRTTISSQDLLTIKTDSSVLAIELDNGEFQMTSNTVGGGGNGIGAYPGGTFEVYGSEGLYITSDDSLNVKFANEMYINDHFIEFPSSGPYQYGFPNKSGVIALTKDIPTFETISTMGIGGETFQIALGNSKTGRLGFSTNGTASSNIDFVIKLSNGKSFEYGSSGYDGAAFLFEMWWVNEYVYFTCGGEGSCIPCNDLTSITLELTGARSSVEIYVNGYVLR